MARFDGSESRGYRGHLGRQRAWIRSGECRSTRTSAANARQTQHWKAETVERQILGLAKLQELTQRMLRSARSWNQLSQAAVMAELRSLAMLRNRFC